MRKDTSGSVKVVRRGVGDGPKFTGLGLSFCLLLVRAMEERTERFLQSVCSPPAPSPPSPVRVFAAGACPYPKAAPSGLRCFQLRARVVTVCGSLGADSRSSAFVGVGTVSVEVSMMRD